MLPQRGSSLTVPLLSRVAAIRCSRVEEYAVPRAAVADNVLHTTPPIRSGCVGGPECG